MQMLARFLIRGVVEMTTFWDKRQERSILISDIKLIKIDSPLIILIMSK